jgi:hypothetical protein
VMTRHLLECIGEGQCSYMHTRCGLQLAILVEGFRPLAGLSVADDNVTGGRHSLWLSHDDADPDTDAAPSAPTGATISSHSWLCSQQVLRVAASDCSGASCCSQEHARQSIGPAEASPV